MKFYIAITDNRWYQFLADLKPDEVNFWKPGGQTSFRALPAGSLFLFKLHSPLNYISGGGYFLKYEAFPMSLVWDAFQEKNGASDFTTFSKMILSHRNDSSHDPIIGCIILTNPFFFDRGDWIPSPENWSPNIQTGKLYNSEDAYGKKIWEEVQLRLYKYPDILDSFKPLFVTESDARYGSAFLSHSRLGQGAFRALVTSAYHRKCAITGEKTLPALEAGHIKPFASSGPSHVNNGILLRSDLHKLFDKGYVTVTPDYHVEVSHAIKEEFENGRDYYAFQGKDLIELPYAGWEKPAREYLEWHNENVFI